MISEADLAPTSLPAELMISIHSKRKSSLLYLKTYDQNDNLETRRRRFQIENGDGNTPASKWSLPGVGTEGESRTVPDTRRKRLSHVDFFVGWSSFQCRCRFQNVLSPLPSNFQHAKQVTVKMQRSNLYPSQSLGTLFKVVLDVTSPAQLDSKLQTTSLSSDQTTQFARALDVEIAMASYEMLKE